MKTPIVFGVILSLCCVISACAPTGPSSGGGGDQLSMLLTLERLALQLGNLTLRGEKSGNTVERELSENGITPDEELVQAIEQRQQNQESLRSLKDSGAIGEGNDGRIHVINQNFLDQYGDYIANLVIDENGSRDVIYSRVATAGVRGLSSISREAANQNRQLAEAGDWVQNSDGEWVQSENDHAPSE